MGRVISKVTKHPSDIAWPGLEPRCDKSVANRTTS